MHTLTAFVLIQDRHQGGRLRDVAVLDLRAHKQIHLFPLDRHTHTHTHTFLCESVYCRGNLTTVDCAA